MIDIPCSKPKILHLSRKKTVRITAIIDRMVKAAGSISKNALLNFEDEEKQQEILIKCPA
jgi:hypothetical protein